MALLCQWPDCLNVRCWWKPTCRAFRGRQLVTTQSRHALLFDDLVGADQQRGRKGETERLGSFGV
jgi:hypothetical protein